MNSFSKIDEDFKQLDNEELLNINGGISKKNWQTIWNNFSGAVNSIGEALEHLSPGI